MVKAKKGGKGSSATATAAPAKCKCDHPFECMCGNRPPRPSRGHKWDAESQTWGGKGHKQKGASGQSSLKAAAGVVVETTAVGKTRIESWQRLPSTILQDYCVKQKRPRPKYKNLSQKPNEFKYRVILPDAKGDDAKDLIFIAPVAVPNEEQAKEECCILVLLQLTPNIPHERTLPEPYKATWLHAIATLKQQQQKSKSNEKDKKIKSSVSAPATTTTTNTNTTLAAEHTTNDGARAQASTHLALAVSRGKQGGTIGTSRAQKSQAAMERRRVQNAKIQRHEALRWANKHHLVIMTNAMRKRIESLLRGDTCSLATTDEEDEDDPNGDDDDDISLVQACVYNRLHQDGFTRRQARKAFQQQTKDKSRADLDAVKEDMWDDLCDRCLQWLYIHVDEADLPVGLDPTEGTLDVIVGTSTAKPNIENANTANTSTSTISTSTIVSEVNSSNINNPVVTSFVARYALTVKDATLIFDDAIKGVQSSCNVTEANLQDCFWKRIVAMANVSLLGNVNDSENKQYMEAEANSLFGGECVVLEAVFSDDCTIEKDDDKNNGTTTVTIVVHVKVPRHVAALGNVDKLQLQVVVENGQYPSTTWPRRVLLSSLSSSSSSLSKPPAIVGVALHVEMARFVATLPLGEPMIYAIHGHVETLLENCIMAENSMVPQFLSTLLLEEQENEQPTSNDKKTVSRGSNSIGSNKLNQPRATLQQQPRQRQRRHWPREKSPFWSRTPQNTPAAVAFPNITGSLKRARQSLPAATARGEFLKALEKANLGGHVLLCTGDTGCGKTTQIPQFILEEYPKDAKIVVCQPRRLAATGVAVRVAEERGESQPGKQSVGYVVRGDAALCEQSRLVFCTTGVLLRQLQSDGALDCLTHIVVDEVHERNLDTDILLALLKQTLPNVPHIRVILMSATLDADRFAAYWGKDTPRIHIPGRTFPVKDYMLEDVLSITGYIPSKKGKGKAQNRPRSSTPWADSETSDVEPEDDEEEQDKAETAEPKGDGSGGGSSHSIPIDGLVDRMDETNVDYDLLARLVKHLIVKKDPTDDGSVLVFLPGAPEINKAMEAIKRVTKDLPIRLLPLHGGLQPKDQNLVFRPVGGGLHKVILSTNVAETSVTIPDCTVVIDSAREKQSSYDPTNRMPLLIEKFCSKASLKQRRGRAGRVREGTCYKLISHRTHATLREHGEPEIQRSALDQTILSLLFLGMDCNPTAGGFLDSLLDPPSKKSTRAAIFSLEKLGAVNFDPQSNNVSLTPLGMHLAGIPAAPIVGKILVMGSILGCRNAGVAMAASLSMGRSPLLRIDAPRKGGRKGTEEPASIEEMKQQNVREERAKLFDKVGGSDHAFLAAVFLHWQQEREGHGRRAYCDLLGLSFMGMREMLQLSNQLDNALQAIGYLDTPESNLNGGLWTIIRAVAVAGMAPGQLVKVVRAPKTYTATAEGAKEKEGVAQELKLFVRTDGPDDENNATSAAARDGNNRGRYSNEERVFIHPSSANFSTGTFSCPWLVYHSLVRTSKAFLRDVTECNTYTLLLFGGKLDVVASEGVATLDNWCKLGASGKICSLVNGLRSKVDDLLMKKVMDPMVDLAATEEMKLIVQLIARNGLE